MEHTYVDMTNITNECVNAKIMLAGRIHNKREQKKVSFITLRKNIHTIQCVLTKKSLGEKYGEILEIPNESYVYFYGVLNKLPDTIDKIKSCSYDSFELFVDNFKLISKSAKLPFSLDDANDINTNKERNSVSQQISLDNRSFDLRTSINSCIFNLQSVICSEFRNNLISKGFMEIHTPKIISTASEGGAQVFPIKYFDKACYLAQSPQLYKQMCVNSDFEKVFEIGSVYRAENTHSHRHLCEFIGLDVECAITPNGTYEEIFNVIWNVLFNIHEKVKKSNYYKYIKNNYAFDELVIQDKPIILTFSEGVKLLSENGFTQNINEDLTTENEKQLGIIVKNIYSSDVFVLNKYPLSVRPFYTMPCEKDNNFSNSYDVIMRGEEICSGSQRIHDYELLLKSISDRNIDINSLSDYVKSFEYGSVPHCGFGMGLERILMLILNLKNVRKTSLFPRDPNRVKP